MKLSPFVIGVISAQGSGDYDSYDAAADGDRGYYGGSDWSGMASNSWNYGSGRALTKQATAVTCWESNNMGTHSTHHQHFVDQADEYGWANTHHGHETAKGTVNQDPDGNALPATTALDYHSALAFDHRLSGCIYEVTDWDFSATTYNKIHTMTFGTSGYDLTNGDIYPVWWHYFNAHVLAGGSIASHKLVMANPTYEGLGYLNFIVTFLKGSKVIANDKSGAIDANRDEDHHTDLYANGDSFTLTIENTAGACDSYAELTTSSVCYSSKYAQGAGTDWSHTNFAISSFPQNDLGKDFRFNLRMMHHLGEGDANEFFDSYYFYRVDKITIVFPAIVSCPWELIDGTGTSWTTHKCMDSAAKNGHKASTQQHGSGANNGTPQYVETLSENTGTSGTVAAYAKICHATGKKGYHSCGDKYEVSGLMHMYDEYAQNEYGTVQEIWFQFYYKYQWSTGTNLADEDTGIYNYPNKLFNAFEVVSVAGTCAGNTSSNQCTGGQATARTEENWDENP